MNESPPPGGLFASLRGLIKTSLALLQNRIELLATELEEERLRLFSMLLYGAAAFFLFGVGVVLLAIFITVLFWDSHRLLVLSGLSAAFLIGAAAAGLLLLRQLRGGSRLFSASLAELARDQEALRDKSQGTP